MPSPVKEKSSQSKTVALTEKNNNIRVRNSRIVLVSYGEITKTSHHRGLLKKKMIRNLSERDKLKRMENLLSLSQSLRNNKVLKFPHIYLQK
jgi:hypothetical protein